jgi:hypothetical protein
MLFLGLDLRYITQRFDAAARSVVAASQASAPAAVDTDHSPSMLQQAMIRLLELLEIVDQQGEEEALSGEDLDLNQLGDYAILILSELADVADSLRLEPESLQLEDLTLPMALWIARHGGELRSLTPIVNALARLASSLRDEESLVQLYRLTNELQGAVDRTVRLDRNKSNPERPWRLLLMNRAIIATRSQQADLIESAYADLVHALPEEAPRFFKDGMQQMELLNYPLVVRQVVEKYYRLWSKPRTLH